MPTVTIGGRTVRLREDKVIGQGGEAVIYRRTNDVVKLYKQPNDPSYAMDAAQQQAARQRLTQQQQKLPAFPKKLASEVVAPEQLVYRGNDIVGFTMPFVDAMHPLMELGNRAWRDAHHLDANQAIEVFRALHSVVDALHASGVVIGDFNDLNVLTDGKKVRIVDADSMQFGQFLCQTYTLRFLDPLRASPDQLVLDQPYNKISDWYAYFVMLIQTLLFTGPYGGVHRPKAGKRLQFDDRVLKRLTFLKSDVVYPKPALPFAILPDELQAYFVQVTEQDRREVFPQQLLNNLRFTACTSCGLWHARGVCPTCQAPGRVRQAMTVRGQVTARREFITDGRIIQAIVQQGVLHYLYEERGMVFREGGRKVMKQADAQQVRWRIQDDVTLAGKNAVLTVISGSGETSHQLLDRYRDALPVFDANTHGHFWAQGGQLRQSHPLGVRYVGDVLVNQTLFWVGDTRGFGFYQAGQLVRGFTFVPGKRGVNDQVNIGPIKGQLIDVACAISDTLIWFFTVTQEAGRLFHRARVIDAHGVVIAELTADAGDDSWLGQGIRGHFASGKALFAATDQGIVRVVTDSGCIVVEREFPDTEPFVSAEVSLLPGPNGIYVVSRRDITLLTLQ